MLRGNGSRAAQGTWNQPQVAPRVESVPLLLLRGAACCFLSYSSNAFSSQLLHLLKFPRSHLNSFDPSTVISIDDAIYLVLLVTSFRIDTYGCCASLCVCGVFISGVVTSVCDGNLEGREKWGGLAITN